MTIGLPKVLVVVGAAIAPASALAASHLSCHADREISCTLKGCTETRGDSFYVSLRLYPKASAGDLCTFTYCRTFILYRLPGTTSGKAVLGVTRSDDSGSTDEMRGKPVLDYLLSITADRKHFTLFNSSEEGVGGWSGPCESKRFGRGRDPS